MIEFFELTMKNFLSYGNTITRVDLSKPGSTLVTGRNLDISPDGSASNGTGKTAIQNAIVYALYDKPLSNITKDNLVNHINGKHMEVSVTFRVDGKYYKVIRARKMKAGPYGNWSKLFEREEDLNFTAADEVTLDSNTNTTAEIVKKIGVPYELFVRIVVFAGRHVPFLSMPSKHPTQPSQQSFIEELFDLKTLTMKADVLKAQIKEGESQFALIQAKAGVIERQKESHTKQLTEARRKRQEWDDQRLSDIAQLRSSLERIKGIDLDQQEEVYKDLKAAKAARSSADQRTAMHSRDAAKSTQALVKLKEEVAHLEDATCPYCKQEFKDTRAKIAELSTQITEVEQQLNDQYTAFNTASLESQAVQETIDSLASSLQFDDLQELLTIKLKRVEIASTIEALEASENPFDSMVTMIEGEVPEDIDQDERNALVDLLDHQRFLHKLLTKNDSFIRKAMLNKNLPFLNTRLNYYLRRMELPHVVEFTHDLTPKITRFGSNFEFDNLSAGQQARVNIALSLSFRDVLQNLHQRINLFLLDEVLDVGLDTAGVMMAAKLLKEEARRSGTCMFIVSHREEISSSFDKKMYVLFENSFSKTYQTSGEVATAESKLHASA
jgi:DNA repair exonuclease SbcCD ATPase subunit